MKKALVKGIFPIVLLIPIGVFFYVFHIFSVNNPFQDDLDGLLNPIAQIVKTKPTFWGFLDIIFQQDDERRPIMVRLVSYWVYLVKGSLDFQWVALIGILTYFIFLGLIYTWFKKQPSISPFYFLPIPFVLFTHINYEALYWSMIPLQHIAVFIWAFLSIWFLTQTSRRSFFILAIFLGLICLSSDVTGNVLLVVGTCVLLVKRQYLRAGLWLVVMGIAVFFYFRGLSVPNFRPSLSENLKNVSEIIKMIVGMCGCFFDVSFITSESKRTFLSLLMGGVSLLFTGYYFFIFIKKVYSDYKQIKQYEIWLWGCLTVLFITFVIFSLGRASFGINSILTNRYKHMFIFWGILNYLLLLQTPLFRTHVRLTTKLTLAAAVLFCMNSYFQVWVEMDYMRKVIITDTYGWYHNRAIPSSPIYLAVKNIVDEMYLDGLNTGVYKPNKYPFEKLVDAPVKGKAKVMLEESRYIVTFVVPALKRGLGADDGIYIVLKSQKNTHILPTKNPRYWFREMLKKRKYYQDVAHSINYTKSFLSPEIPYQVYLGVLQGNQQYCLETGIEVNFPKNL
jgi:hypothetical protein